MHIYYRLTKRWIVPISILAVVLFLIFSIFDFGYDIIDFLYGGEWRDGGALIAGLSVYACGIFVFEHAKVVAMAEGHSHVAVVARVCQLIVIAVTVVPLIYLWGLYGAGLASASGAIVLYGVTAILLRRAADGMS